jgi:hypothetical protein
MLRRWTPTLGSICTLATLLALPAWGELPDNRISNGEFDLGLDGWTELFPAVSSFLYISYEDANGCSLSGAAEAGNSNPADSGSTSYRICTTEFTEGVPYTLYARFLFHPTLVESRAQLSLGAHNSANCSDAATEAYVTPYAFTSDGFSTWHYRKLQVPVTPTASTQSLQVQLTFIKDVGADNVAYVLFDRVHLVPANWIYAEDFELSELCRWSSIVPAP